MIEDAAITIVAAVTAPVSSGVGIVRLSGPSALSIARRLASSLPSSVEPRHAYFTSFSDRAGQILDEGLFLYFRAPHSFTGEEVVELQVHGSPKLLELIVAELLAVGPLRLAEPGEFSRRAFLNGRIDLTRAEAIADLVSADSELAVRAAAAQLRGVLSERLAQVRVQLFGLQADLEGALNFPDETDDDLPADSWSSALETVDRMLQELISEERSGQLIRRGARVVLFGPVNAGKSTLFNRLLGEDRALVDEMPGTTRDLVEARWSFMGCAVTLVDTAGIRTAPERIEALGIERARAALRGADLGLLVLPRGTSAGEMSRWNQEAGETPCVRVVSKADLREVDTSEDGGPSFNGLTGEGIEGVQRGMVSALGLESLRAVGQVGERHAEALRRAKGHLENARSAMNASTLEVVAGEVGLAAEAFGEVTGENVSASVLDEIFRRFCIGK